MESATTFLLKESKGRNRNIMPTFRNEKGELWSTFGAPSKEWHIAIVNGKEVLYKMTYGSLDRYPYLSEEKDVAEIWGYCHIERLDSFLPWSDLKETIVFQPIPVSKQEDEIIAQEYEIIRSKLRELHRMVVFRGEQEELRRRRDYEKAQAAMRCSKGGNHVWTHAECYDAYGIEYTLTCGKCGTNMFTLDWQEATRIQVGNIAREEARLEIGCAVTGCSPKVEGLLQEVKKHAADALRIAEEHS